MSKSYYGYSYELHNKDSLKLTMKSGNEEYILFFLEEDLSRMIDLFNYKAGALREKDTTSNS